MIDGHFVVDGVVHGFNFQLANLRQPWMQELVRGLHMMGFGSFHPVGDRRYWLEFEQFADMFAHQPAAMESALFAESPIDVAIYHGVPMYGLFGDGSSPIWVGQRIAERFPHRLFLYPDLSPTHPDAEAWIDEFTAIPNVIGVKFYPADVVEGRIVGVRLDDERRVVPLIERCRARGIRTIAVHKAVPLGPIPRDFFDVGDMDSVIRAFPDLQFEIVHGGFAFAEETAELLETHENVWINLETNPCFAVNHADKFADMLAPLLATGRHDRLIFGTGATGMHPRPFVEAFRHFRMPPHLPQLDDAMIAGILGLNVARLHGWDVPALQAACAADAYGTGRPLVRPWDVVHRAQEALAP
ncbi:hypothetical protein IP88_04830 [alpha proteobacterium AAP81b]|nr:hypothetical protein IP88_04830 [alpha proteobacterium AAP81b]